MMSSRVLCHNNGRYNFYSTTSDGFIYASSLSLEQVKSSIKDGFGETGLRRLDARLARAHKNGHSSVEDSNLDGFLCCNRAGDSESFLSTKECIDRFLS